jgi:TetR/AcrR family transcriptional repressor of nem operon
MRVTRQKAAENRRRVLETAGALFREKGIDGIGVADLMKAAGLTHGGFYGQFDSKDDLAAEAITSALAKSAESWRARAAAAPDDPFGALAAYYVSRKHSDRMGTGCPISALGGEMARQSDPVRRSFTKGFVELLDILTAVAPGATEAERREKALATFSGIAGAVMIARAVDDPGLSDEILDAARKAFAEPAAAGG